MTLRSAALMTETSLLWPLKAQTVWVEGSKRMASGPWPTGMVSTVAKVARSKMTTALAPPSEMYPNLPALSRATPWMALRSVTVPMGLPVYVSRTSTWVPRVM